MYESQVKKESTAPHCGALSIVSSFCTTESDLLLLAERRLDDAESFVDELARDHQGRRDPEGLAVRVLAQQTGPDQHLAGLLGRSPALVEVDADPETDLTDLGEGHALHLTQPTTEVVTEPPHVGEQRVVIEQLQRLERDRAGDVVAAERRSVRSRDEEVHQRVRV